MKINILHIIDSMDYRKGGPPNVALNLCNYLSQNPNLNISIVYQSELNDILPLFLSKVNVYNVACSNRLQYKSGIKFRSWLISYLNLNTVDIIYIHGIWTAVSYWGLSLAVNRSIKCMLHIHGMLLPYALMNKPLKKKLGFLIYQKRLINNASVLISTSYDEYRNIRKLGFTNPIFNSFNGIDPIDPTFFNVNTQYKKEGGFKTVLFLSRIHPMKGILNLIEAWDLVSPNNWRLLLAGPDSYGHLAEVMNLVKKYNLSKSISYVGEINGPQEKAKIFLSADIFILPSRSENFGNVIAESLAYGVPVITTKGAPWADLETYKCGWWVDYGVKPLAEALVSAISLEDCDRFEMGQRGQQLVKKFDWSLVSTNISLVYAWLLFGGQIPDCISLE